jgi:glycosyltransferase involved in cell wall biosynthesis
MSGFDATVVICTWNRAQLLDETLASLAAMPVPGDLSWEVLIVDNRSTDRTASVVAERAVTFPVPLRYVFEGRQGKSWAMNTGISASASPVIVFADDDVQVLPEWLPAACEPLLAAGDVSYTGGPVEPIWDAPCPAWFDDTGKVLWGTFAILDYGTERFVFEERRRIPLGANFAVRRTLAERVGGFDPSLGRNSDRVLMGQELPEFFARTRQAGATGLYVPEMRVRHHVPANRLTHSYCRRWWYGKGVSRARMEALHPVTELGIDLRQVPTIFGVPRFLVGTAVRDCAKWLAAAGRGRQGARLAAETQLYYFGGQVMERLRQRRH